MPTGLGDEVIWLCPSLDDSPNDLSGNGNNGTYVNGTATVADSDPTYGGSRAYNFDGTDSYIDIQGLTGQYTTGGSHSTSVWVYQDTVRDQFYFMRYQSVTADQRSEYLFAQSLYSRTGAGFKQSGASNVLYVNSTNQSGAWYNLATTYDSTTRTQTIYKNGVSVGSTVFAGNGTWSTNYAEVGRVRISGGATELYSNLKMDDIRSFTRVLTQSEITLLASTRGFTAGGGTHINRTLLGVG